MPINTSTSHRTGLRAKMRERRRFLSPWQQQQTANSIARLLNRHPIYRRSHHIAFYISNDGEVDLTPLLRISLAAGKHCYLPKIEARRMRFIEYRSDTALIKNQFGIAEPLTGREILAAGLDLVLMPLVAFDRRGNRLGMGGGFYDRCFSHKIKQPGSKPVLLGIGHDFQEVNNLSRQHWDVPLDSILTSSRYIDISM